MYNSILLKPAKDIREAADWCNSGQRGLGRRFTNEVCSKESLIRKNPEVSVLRYKDVRTAMLDAFPFMIHYTVDHHNQKVIISVMFLTSLSPDRWMERG